MKLKKLTSLLLAGALTLSLAACGATKGADGSAASSPAASSTSSATAATKTASGLPALTADEIHIGAVFNTELGTEGFSYALGQGFKALEDAGYKVDYAFNIPESAECETAIENLINQGCNVIYATSYGYGEYVANVAAKYPNVYFNHYSGSNNANNLATFFPKNFQSEYLCGIIAGMRTKSNQIGYLCSYPIPECVRMVDAFTLGAKSVNPDVTVNVKWTGSWFDPATETATATELVNSGSDVVIAYLDSLNAAIAAADLGAYSFGYATSGYDTIPNSYLTSPACDWKSFFLKDVQSIIDGTWTGMVDEMWLTSLIHKGWRLDPTVVPSQDILRMATRWGARALLDDKLYGTLEAGKKADLIVIDPQGPSMMPVNDKIAALVTAMHSANITCTMCDGKWLMKDRKILSLDEELILKEGAARAAAIYKRAGIELPDRFPVVRVKKEETLF